LERRLCAILAADVVGYSRLMELDETGTLAELKRRRQEVLDPLVAAHRGRIVKVMGDGVLVEFGSAVNAVSCAIELQKRMADANAGAAAGREIVLRIGVNLCDAIVEGADLYGDGVNVAARLQALTEPGGILVSGTAYDHVRNKVEAAFEELGPIALKNLSEPVRAYRVAASGAAPTPRPAIDPSREKPTIAVLPFANLSGDPEQAYFIDGITEDIVTGLSHFRQLFVIASNSSFQYRDKSSDLRRVATDVRGAVVPPCGHFIPQEPPEVLASLLVDFFAEDVLSDCFPCGTPWAVVLPLSLPPTPGSKSQHPT
jgi:class 3 adenylate cyclase